MPDICPVAGKLKLVIFPVNFIQHIHVLHPFGACVLYCSKQYNRYMDKALATGHSVIMLAINLTLEGLLELSRQLDKNLSRSLVLNIIPNAIALNGVYSSTLAC